MPSILFLGKQFFMSVTPFLLSATMGALVPSVVAPTWPDLFEGED